MNIMLTQRRDSLIRERNMQIKKLKWLNSIWILPKVIIHSNQRFSKQPSITTMRRKIQRLLNGKNYSNRLRRRKREKILIKIQLNSVKMRKNIHSNQILRD